MKLRIAILIALLSASGAGSKAPPTEMRPIVAELAGRIAGKPQRCIPGQPGLLFQISGTDPHLLLYDDGKKIWASDLGPNCGFEPGQIVVPDESASYYCHGDQVRAGGRVIIFPGGHCALGDFTPYSGPK